MMDDSVIHSPLGKNASYVEQYDPSLLFPIPRLVKRSEIGIGDVGDSAATLPFWGADIWNAYELSWLNPHGKPQIALATFIIPADSTHIIESKSFKLYLNSFNQTVLPQHTALQTLLVNDLSKATHSSVVVELILPASFDQQYQTQHAPLAGYCLDDMDVVIDTYQPAPMLLCNVEGASHTIVEETLVSHLLKSNCLVTGQPDWGSVQIHYRGAPIAHDSLLKYLISFRQHTEFHEQCVERIFMDIQRQCQPQTLSVYALYTRRGGLDINPFRTNNPNAPLPSNQRTARQ